MKQGQHKEHTGTGKRRGRRGRTKEGKTRKRAGGEEKGKGLGCDNSNPSPRADTRRADLRGGGDQLLDQEDGEGERGDLPGYTPTPEDL